MSLKSGFERGSWEILILRRYPPSLSTLQRQGLIAQHFR